MNENDTMPVPEFLPKGSPNCKRGRTDGACGIEEVEKNPTATGTDWPIDFLSSNSGGVEDYK